jgi:ATP-dependent protease Clp ATPase subunit
MMKILIPEPRKNFVEATEQVSKEALDALLKEPKEKKKTKYEKMLQHQQEEVHWRQTDD